MIQTKEDSLVRKYNIPGPRYTSYPTVPYWSGDTFKVEKYLQSIKNVYLDTAEEGISIYIHLPFCESLCTYCGCTTRITVNHAVEEPYIETLLKEWKLYTNLLGEKPLIKELHLGGGTPTFFKPDNLKNLMVGLFRESRISKTPDFGFEAHPNSTSFQHLKVLNDLGFERLSLGIQDFDPVVQDIVNRKQSFETVKKVTEMARQTGYTSINYDLIYGLPFQKTNSIKDTIDKISVLSPDRIAFYSYAHVPWIKPGQRRFTEMDLPDNEEKRQLYELGRDMLKQNNYHEIGMDHFAKPSDPLFIAMKNGSLHRNFMGYTTNKTKLTIGLGVSAIGDSWNAFAQNIKVVEKYRAEVDEGKFPIFRGHILNKEDSIIRKHILNLMCLFKTSWEQEEYEIMEPAIERMSEAESDGLIEINKNKIRILPEGRPFVRNVCMALDARLWRCQPDSQIFSKVI